MVCSHIVMGTGISLALFVYYANMPVFCKDCVKDEKIKVKVVSKVVICQDTVQILVP